MLDCHTAHTASSLVLKEKIDQYFGKNLKDGPKFMKYDVNDDAIIDMIPGKPMSVESCLDCPPLGQLVVHD